MVSACPGKRSPAVLTELHRKFLDRLHRVSPTFKQGSNVIAEVKSGSTELRRASSTWSEASRSVLNFAENAIAGELIDCSFSHGDFAPCNTVLDGDRLFVIDWEMAGPGKPTAWDVFHFGIRAWRGDINPECLPKPKDPIGTALYLLYLLDSAGSLAHGGKSASSPTIELRLKLINECLLSQRR